MKCDLGGMMDFFECDLTMKKYYTEITLQLTSMGVLYSSIYRLLQTQVELETENIIVTFVKDKSEPIVYLFNRNHNVVHWIHSLSLSLSFRLSIIHSIHIYAVHLSSFVY